MIHTLKTETDVFLDIKNGKKTFDFRRNDRNFQVGDWLNFIEYNPVTGALGMSLDFEVTYILQGGRFGIPEGYCIMSIKRLKGMYHG